MSTLLLDLIWEGHQRTFPSWGLCTLKAHLPFVRRDRDGGGAGEFRIGLGLQQSQAFIFSGLEISPARQHSGNFKRAFTLSLPFLNTSVLKPLEVDPLQWLRERCLSASSCEEGIPGKKQPEVGNQPSNEERMGEARGMEDSLAWAIRAPVARKGHPPQVGGVT